jgi:PAS domain S-box-containing protein
MTSRLDGLRVGIIGDREAADALHDQRTDGARIRRIRDIPPEAPASDLTETDCLLVDEQSQPDTWQTIVEGFANRQTTTPVIVLVSSDFETTVSAAIEAGADEYIPPSLCRSQPDLVTKHLADLVGKRSRAVDHENRDEGAPARHDEVAERFRLMTENVGEVIYIANADFTKVEYVN